MPSLLETTRDLRLEVVSSAPPLVDEATFGRWKNAFRQVLRVVEAGKVSLADHPILCYDLDRIATWFAGAGERGSFGKAYLERTRWDLGATRNAA